MESVTQHPGLFPRRPWRPLKTCQSFFKGATCAAWLLTLLFRFAELYLTRLKALLKSLRRWRERIRRLMPFDAHQSFFWGFWGNIGSPFLFFLGARGTLRRGYQGRAEVKSSSQPSNSRNWIPPRTYTAIYWLLLYLCGNPTAWSLYRWIVLYFFQGFWDLCFRPGCVIGCWGRKSSFGAEDGRFRAMLLESLLIILLDSFHSIVSFQHVRYSVRHWSNIIRARRMPCKISTLCTLCTIQMTRSFSHFVSLNSWNTYIDPIHADILLLDWMFAWRHVDKHVP